MLEAEHPEICKADEVIAETQRLQKALHDTMAEERKRIVAVTKAMQIGKPGSHQVQEIISKKEQGYQVYPIPQYERQ